MQEILFAKSATFRGKGYFAASGRWKDFILPQSINTPPLYSPKIKANIHVLLSLFSSSVFGRKFFLSNQALSLAAIDTRITFTCLRIILPLPLTIAFYPYLSPLLYTCAFYHCFISLPFTIDTYLYLLPLLNTCTFYHCIYPDLVNLVLC